MHELSKETESARQQLIDDGHKEEAIDAYIELGTGDDDLSDFEEAYQGQYDSDEDFAREMAEQLGAIDTNASWPNNCIDWEYAAREIMYDYSESNGYYFRSL